MKNKIILVNSIITPDGTILTSVHRHDYVAHKDKNGLVYAVDGGTTYLRRLGNLSYLENSKFLTEDHSHNRKYFHWTSYGKLGDEPANRQALKDMATSHIEAILETQSFIKNTHMEDLFLNELNFRITKSG